MSESKASKHIFNLVRDKYDHKDKYYLTSTSAILPPSVDLSKLYPYIYDQGNLGSCTANALSYLIGYDDMKQYGRVFYPSRLFIYYNERNIEGTVTQDAGASLGDGIKTLQVNGVCDEHDWEYNIGLFALKPGPAIYTKALLHKALDAERVPQVLTSIKTCLFSGIPIAIGISVYSSFESPQVAKTGMVPMPGESDEFLGGHAVAIVGYDDATQRFRLRNSWGTNWADGGYFYLPYAYVMNPQLTSDLWKVVSIADTSPVVKPVGPVHPSPAKPA